MAALAKAALAQVHSSSCCAYMSTCRTLSVSPIAPCSNTAHSLQKVLGRSAHGISAGAVVLPVQPGNHDPYPCLDDCMHLHDIVQLAI